MCRAWKNKRKRKTTCCPKPNYFYYVIQERASDEMPTAYKECKNCKHKSRAS